jgi:catechol 2,3-dioxygenase-like lactoylglutathione lyase family enzyme
VITLCDRVREICPEFPSHPQLVHWSIPDPVREGSTNRASNPVFERTAAELYTRIRFLLHLLAHPRTRGGPHMRNDETVNVRYMVDDVDDAIAFCTQLLGFELLTSASPAFADVKRRNLRLLVAGPTSSAGRPMPDGTKPGPGGWNRIHFIVDDLADEVARLRDPGATFRNDIVKGPGGKQILLLDPSGNVIELFQPAARPQRA